MKAIHAELTPIIVEKLSRHGSMASFCRLHNFKYSWLRKSIHYKCFSERHGFNGLARLLMILEIPVSEAQQELWNLKMIFENEAAYRKAQP